MSVTELIAEVDRGPEGPGVGAFFDFDGTLISGYSATAFYMERLRRREVSPRELAQSLLAGIDVNLRGADVSQLMQIAARAWAGRLEDELEEVGGRLLQKRIAGMVYPEARALGPAPQGRALTV